MIFRAYCIYSLLNKCPSSSQIAILSGLRHSIPQMGNQDPFCFTNDMFLERAYYYRLIKYFWDP